MAKISIIVPAYNRERYIAKCLDSLLAQTYKDYEIIVVDNNSEDRTAVIADEYARQNPKITVIPCKKQGVSCARNAGMKAATGDFISFIDSDDYVDPEMFAELHAKAVEHKADIVVCGIQKPKKAKNSKARILSATILAAMLSNVTYVCPPHQSQSSFAARLL